MQLRRASSSTLSGWPWRARESGEGVGRGDEHAGVVAQLAADELGILREAVAQDEVDGVAVEVDEAVRQVHDEAQLRVALAVAVMHFFF